MAAESSNLPRPSRLLVVEDDLEIIALLQRYFSAQGFEVRSATDGHSMRSVLQTEGADVILLDLGLPGEDGFTLTRYLRENWKVGLIILTGRGESVDRIVGLELGADDYVTKPFELRELLARVRSVLRRTTETSASRVDAEAPVLRFAGFSLDPNTRTLCDTAGNPIALTSGEYDLLCVMLDQPNRVLSRDQLMDHLHGRDAGPYDRAIDVQIGRLRRKMEVDPTEPTLIKSVRGAGYLFAARVQRG